MRIIVQKYGGSSVGSPEKILAVAKKIAAAKNNETAVVVVVSAMGDTTDHLLTLAASITKKPRSRELDMLLTSGERISIALLCMALWDIGCPATSFTGSQCGMITDHVHTRARILSVNAERIVNELQKGNVVAAAGFQGVSATREITTLGRGGSDTSAVALAQALGAEICEIYTDVDGIYTADPRIIPDARHIPFIGYESMLDLANFGAKVMHPRAIELARQYNLPLVVRSSFSDAPGTIIGQPKDIFGEKNNMEKPRINAISTRSDVVRLKGRMAKPAFAGLLAKLGDRRINLMYPRSDSDGDRIFVSFWVPEDEFASIEADVASSGLIAEQNLGILAVSGYELFLDLSLVEELLAMVGNTAEISGFSSTATGLYIFLPKDKLTETAQQIHKKFISRGNDGNIR